MPKPWISLFSLNREYQRRLNPLDNLNIKGIRDDEPTRWGKKCRGRKPYVLECQMIHPEIAPPIFGLRGWQVWGRYETAVRRDQAYAALVRREESTHHPWGHITYRKRDD